MPHIIYLKKIIESIEEVLLELEQEKRLDAEKKLKLVVDSLLAICGTTSDGQPVPVPKNAIQFHTPIEDSIEKDNAIKEGTLTGKKIDLEQITKDLHHAHYQMQQNNYSAAREELSQIFQDLKNRNNKTSPSKYEDNEKIGDLILESRTDANNQTKTIFAKYIPIDEAKELLEKYIETAYREGQKSGKKEAQEEQTQKEKVSLE